MTKGISRKLTLIYLSPVLIEILVKSTIRQYVFHTDCSGRVPLEVESIFTRYSCQPVLLYCHLFLVRPVSGIPRNDYV